MEVVELVRAARGGDEGAFSALVDTFNRRLAQVIYIEYGCGADELQDVLQEVWISAWQSLPSLQAPERFPAWLYALARNRTRTLRNKQRSHESHMVAPPPLDPEQADGLDPLGLATAEEADSPEAQVTGAALREAALSQLPPKERVAFSLRVIAVPPWEFEQIAEALGVKAVSVRVAYSRACERLAEWWKTEGLG